MSAQPQPRLTPEEYLELERAAEFRHEYYNGHIYLMAGGTVRRALIAHNLHHRLGSGLEKLPCIVVGADVRLCVASGGLYTYPDLMVVCGDPKYGDDRQDTLLNPVLII